MDIQKMLFWHQGLFLQPQHFQLLDLSFQSRLHPFYNFLQPHFWGITKIEIQQSALAAGSFHLTGGGFLFPDGTYAVISDNAVVEVRTFAEAWIEGGKPLHVYIGLKKLSSTGGNVTVMEKPTPISDVTTRFVTKAEPEKIKDLHSDGPEGEVKRLNYVLKIFWETETTSTGDYDLIPLGRLEKSGQEVALSANYVPPCLTIFASEALFKMTKEIRDLITARSRQLEEYKKQRGIQTAEFGSRDMVYLLSLRSLNRYVPILSHYTETRHVHPWIVYGTLRQLIGELSSFSEKVNVMGEAKGEGTLLPEYDHRTLWECFSVARALVSQLIDEITAGPEYVISMVYDGTYYATDLNPAVFESRNRFYLVCRTEEDPKSAIQALTTIAKLSSRKNLPLLIARALPGVGLQHLSAPPQELPRRAHTLYFAIDYHSDQWDFVKKSNNIALYWDHAPEDLEVVLMIAGK